LHSWRTRNGILCWTGCKLKLTAICIVDRTGKNELEGVVPSDPEAIAIFIKLHAPHVARVGGDAMLRSYLYEAANVLLTRVAKCLSATMRPTPSVEPVMSAVFPFALATGNLAFM
jgi:hypothetical protein